VRTLLRTLVTLALGAGLVAVPVVAAPAAHAAPDTDYVALGDSYSSGTGTGSYDLSVGCQRSSAAYPALWASRQGARSFAFAACSGATTADVRASQLGALSAGTDLVTITIGGNDADFVGTVLACRLGSDADCFGKLATASAFITGTLPGLLDATYQAVRGRAPNARLVVLGYPRLYRTGFCLLAISDERRSRINAVADTLAAVTAQRAQAAGATFVDARGAFAGHEICSSAPWINGPTWPLGDSYHPNRTGHAQGYLPALTAVAT
jgi:lysophospholipase L1-like esterase